jgi:tetratricopeptide (TPR) repeat protein
LHDNMQVKKGLIAAVLGILLADCTPKKGLSQPLELYLYSAERKLAEGDPRGAIETYQEIIRVVDAPEAWFGMSGAFLAAGDTDSAMISYFGGIQAQEQMEQSDPYYWMRMGYWYGRTGEKEKALEAFKKALDLNPEDAKAWNNIGVVYHEEEEYGEAIPYFKKAIALDPTDQRFWYNLGLAYHHIGAYDDAITAYNASLHIVEARAKVWNDLGVTYRVMGELDKALTCYDRALGLAPQDPDIWFNKGLLLDRMGKEEEAMYCYMKWAEFAVSWRAYLYAGKKAADLGKFPLAWTLLDKALYYKPASNLVWSARVYAGWKEGGVARAREEIAASGRYLSEKSANEVRVTARKAVSRLVLKMGAVCR